MKSATVGWSFYMILMNFSQQSKLVRVWHFTWYSHDSFGLWESTPKIRFAISETSSFDEIKNLISIRNLSWNRWCPFSIIFSEWPMLIVTVYFTCFTYLLFTEKCCPAQSHFDSNGDNLHLLDILWEGISNGQGQDRVLQLPVHAQAGVLTDMG